MTANIHVDDIGTEFLFTFLNEREQIINLTGATLTAIFSSPEEPFSVDLEEVNAAEGTAKYVTVEGDLPIPGHWRVQGFAEFSADLKLHTSVHRFQVLPNLIG